MSEINHAFENAKAHYESISNGLQAIEEDIWDELDELLEELRESGNLEDLDRLAELQNMAEGATNEDEMREHLEEMALDLSVRSDWCPIGTKLEAAEYKILLTTGGPALRIVGFLHSKPFGDLLNGEPATAEMQYQDYGIAWTKFHCCEDTLLAYASLFYFGE
jgi:hypothetical protein